MNTEYVRKIAISKKLGEMLEHSCKYSPKDKAARGAWMEPDMGALFQFMDEISRLAKLHYKNQLTMVDVENVLEFCNDVGKNVGHVFSNGFNTGTWGVRISHLGDLLKILAIPDYELIEYGTEITWYGSPVKVNSFQPDSDWMVVRFQSIDMESVWEYPIYWKDLEVLKK